MFTDQSFEAVGFQSQVSSEKSEKVTSVQTEKLVCESAEVQTVEKRNVETQTVSQQTRKPHIDYDKLAAFLRRVTPAVLEELDEAYNSNAFNDYNPNTDGESSTKIQLLTKLNTMEEPDSTIKISDLTWSTRGGTLAVSHSIVYHDTWCDHLSKIKFYNLTRDEQFPMVPSKTLEVNACVTSLSYHPTEPSIIAAGLFNGDVLVWNLRDESSVTPITICTHSDSVSLIYWRLRPVDNVSLLVTSSTDGYMMIHKLMANFTTVKLSKWFKIAKEHNPSENARPPSAGGKRERAVDVGLYITSFDFSFKDPTLFIIGTLCGGLYKCSTDRATPIEGNKDILDPVVDEYQRHQGSVTCVKCSPTRDLFITSGTDKEIRIFAFTQSEVQQLISVEDTVVGLTWSIGNPNVFSTYGAGSTVRFYNVISAKTLTNVELQSKDARDVCCLQFNSQRDTVALGDASGNLEIWKIPRRLTI